MNRGTLIAVFVLLALAAPGFAAITIDFGDGLAGPGGLFSLNGTNATGSNIPIARVTISGAPSNNGIFAVTGTCSGTGPGALTNVGCLNFDTNSGTNFINIIGAIPSLGIASETLLSGTISSFTANANGLLSASGPDAKAADLLAVIGGTGTSFSFFGFSLTTTPILSNPGSGTVTSTDIRNDGVPEPSSVALFGTMLVGCAAILRRRWSAVR